MYIFLAGMWLIRKKRAKHVYFPKHHILYQVDKMHPLLGILLGMS